MSSVTKPRFFVAALLGAFLLIALCLAGCANDDKKNLAQQNTSENARVVNFFSPMEKVKADTENTARTASDRTISMAEDELGLEVAYHTYTADGYQDKTYDEVCLERAKSNQDDLYMLNADTIVELGSEGYLADLSGLDSAANLRDVVKQANTVDGKLVAIPQEVVAHGLFVNNDILKENDLALPNTPEEFLEACRVLQQNGYEHPVGANRWWLESFVFAQAYDELYNGDDVESKIAALNSGEARYSDYMRPGFEFLKKLIDEGYVDAENALTSEAFEGEGEGEDFMNGECPFVMAYWGAANTDTAYGNPNFNLEVIGFPSDMGQMPVLSITGLSVGEDAEHREDALEALDVMVSDEALQLYAETNKVISPSKNVNVECIEALKPLNDLVQEDKYVLASNAAMDVEQWGNVCLIVRDLLGGASVDECMSKIDALQDEAHMK